MSLWVASVVGAIICLLFAVARARYRSIPELERVGHAASPDCMVIIPARDEERLIGRAVASLPHDTVIVVDDDSSDRTAEVARKSGAGVLRAPELARGAIGKANACMAGARALNSKWILFTDADTCYAPGFLETMVGCAEASGLAFLSAHLRAESRSALVPYARALFFCGVSADPVALFNGQCLLVDREAYEFLGGHAAVLNSLIDDVKIAALARRHRLKFGTVRAASLGSVQFREPAALLQRSAYRFLLVGFWSGGAILIAAVMTALWLPALVWLLLDRQWLAAAIFAFVPSIATFPWYRNWRALLAPAAIYRILPMLIGSAARALLGWPVEWKGRLI